MRILMSAGLFLALGLACSAGESAANKLKTAGANKWVQLGAEKSGGRRWPIFVHHPGLKRYLLSAGGGGGYDQQVFDPGNCTWSDFFPKGKGSLPSRVKMGVIGPGKVVDGVFRIRRIGNAFRPTDPHTYYQWALDPQGGELYAYFQNATMKFDAAAGLWKALRVPAFSGAFIKGRIYNSNLTMGALAWDPVNKDVVSCGGNDDSDGGSPGTWTFKPGAKKWQRVVAGSGELKALRSQAREFERKTHALVNAWRNRFYMTETDEEAKADIGKRASVLAKSFEKLIAEIRKTRLTGFEKEIPGQAAGFFSKVLAELKAAAANSDPRARLLALGQVRDHVEIAARSLASEPCGRGLSQMAVDLKRGKIVLFGGCRLDSYLADTWVYHCKERKWEQRWPKVSPAPRAGHTLAWLPKSGKIVIFGSTNYDTHYTPPYQVKNRPRDLWVYDIEGNRWKLLAQSGKPPANGTGAVGPNDELIFLPRIRKGRAILRQTWGLLVNASAPDAGSAKAGVAPGTVTYCFHGPDRFDGSAKIEPKKIDAFLKGLPPNRWTPMPRQSPNCNGHEWCASAYDAGRHQILFYGGGHSRWHYNDVSHYSLRTATWSTGYRDEYPFGPSAFKSPVNQSFNNRPFFGSHIWDAIAFDPVADRAVMCTRANAWAYDPAAREWTYPPRRSVGEGVKVAMGETPHGAVQWHAGKLLLYSKETGKWKPLPVAGPKLGGVFAEDSFVCYDPKRGCLWLSRMGNPVYRYDFKGGKLTAFKCRRPPHGRRWMRETVYVPGLDMLVGVGRAKSPDGAAGNLAFDIEAGKWVVLAFDYGDGKEHLTTGSSGQHVSDGLHYDPLYKVLLLNRNNRQVLVARPEKKGLKILEAPVAKPKGK